MLNEVNEIILDFHEEEKEEQDDDNSNDDGDSSNKGTLMLDATCAPSYIKYPQDIRSLQTMPVSMPKKSLMKYKENNIKKPRTYRRRARKDYLSIAKRKKKSKKIIRKAIRKQLSYVTRDADTLKKCKKVASN